MEKGTMLKKSQFNFSTRDEKGDILLCNFAKGMKSLSRIKAEDSSEFNRLFSKDTIVYSPSEKHIVKLVEKGILVPQTYDELLAVNELFYECAMDNKVRLVIIPTEQCNFRCKYCYETYQKEKMTEDDQISLLKFIQRKINCTKKLQISWFGGEPLEAVDVIRRVMTVTNNMTIRNNVQLMSDMTTNAYNLDAKTFDELYNLNVRIYQITLDGLEAQHNNQRVLKNGEGTFRRIVNNLLYIRDNYTKYKLTSISIRVNIEKTLGMTRGLLCH